MRDARKRIAAIVLAFALAFAAVGCDGKTPAQNGVADAINALPQVSELTVGDAAAVRDARTLYDALSSDEKAKVSNYDMLTAAEAVMATLMEIAALTPSFTSGETALVGVPYVPQITGYAFGEVETQVTYTVHTPNSAGAVLESGSITAANAGTFTVEAVVTYTGYNIKRNAERTVTVTDPEPPVCTLNGKLSYDATLTTETDFTGAAVKIGMFDATVQPNGSWTADVPYGTYNVVATHPKFAAKPIENFTVSADTSAPAIKFELYAVNGRNADVYDWEHKAYNQTSDNPRIDFSGMKVEANEEFVLKAEILQSTNTTNNWKYGLTIHDGNTDAVESAFSFGILLANDSNGRFMGYRDLYKTPVSQGSQPLTGTFGAGSSPVLPSEIGTGTIYLTYLRKQVEEELKWYMIAEWDSTGDGRIDKRFVREPADNSNGRDFKTRLKGIDNTAIRLGLTVRATDTVTGVTKWNNLYFATGKTAVDAVDVEDGLNVPDYAIAAIDGLPAANVLTIEHASTVESARALYNALNSTGKAGVTNYAKLTAAEAVMTKLKAIEALTPAFTSAATATVNVAFAPQITGYEVSDVEATVTYSISTTKENTANATLSGETVTATQAGKFTVVAEITYTGYNIKHSIEQTVTVVNPEAPKCTLTGQLSFDSKLTNSVDYTGATVKIGSFDATVQSDGSWTAEVPYDTYTVTATHPHFVTKTVENVVVGETTSAPEIAFEMFSAHGHTVYPANTDGKTVDVNNPQENTNVTVDTQNNTYNVGAVTLTRTCAGRINFDATTVKAGDEFMFRVDLLYSGNSATNWKYGLTVLDTTNDAKKSAFSLGVFLQNSGSGRFVVYKGVNIRDKYVDKTTEVSCYRQGFDFGMTTSSNGATSDCPKLPVNDGEEIRLTYLRKKEGAELKWYMIAEWNFNDQGVASKRYVREQGATAATEFEKCNNADICLGLSTGLADATNGVTRWGNLYFATGENVVPSDLDLTIN